MVECKPAFLPPELPIVDTYKYWKILENASYTPPEYFAIYPCLIDGSTYQTANKLTIAEVKTIIDQTALPKDAPKPFDPLILLLICVVIIVLLLIIVIKSIRKR